MNDPIYRIVIRVTADPDMPEKNPGATPGVCSRCRHRVWVDAQQELPEFIHYSPRPMMPLCMQCAMADPELLPSVLEMLLPAMDDFMAGRPASAYKDGQPWDGTEEEKDATLSSGLAQQQQEGPGQDDDVRNTVPGER